jgi:hypothetical protein
VNSIDDVKDIFYAPAHALIVDLEEDEVEENPREAILAGQSRLFVLDSLIKAFPDFFFDETINYYIGCKKSPDPPGLFP